MCIAPLSKQQRFPPAAGMHEATLPFSQQAAAMDGDSYSSGSNNFPVPMLIEFQRQSSVSDDYEVKCDNLDELLALNTVLCYLVSINADRYEVEEFCVCHPNALLLDGVNNLPEESAKYIVEQQMHRCACFAGSCSNNRLSVLDILKRGFDYYQDRNLTTSKTKRPSWDMYFDEILKIEHEIRELRSEEFIMRNRLVETAVELRGYQEELAVAQREANSRSTLALLACPRNSSSYSRRVHLENKVSACSLNMNSVEREHKVVLRQIRRGRQMQFAVLKTAFAGCRRHVCVVSTPRFPKYAM